MNLINSFRCFPAMLALLFTMVAGCAGVPVSNQTIQDKTAITLNLTPSAFTISDRVNEGEKSSYTVSTQRGKKYRCHVTGTASLTGSGLSNAICSEISAASKPSAR